MAARPLAKRARRHGEVRLLLLLSLGCLLAGFSLPAMAIRKFGFWSETYSILGGIEGLWESGETFVAAVLFIFAFVFPLTKLLFLALVWYLPVTPRRRDGALRWVHHLGRWAMLDIFVVAVLLLMTRANPVVSVRPEAGVYFFTFAILFSMILTFRIDQLQRRYERRRWRR